VQIEAKFPIPPRGIRGARWGNGRAGYGMGSCNVSTSKKKPRDGGALGTLGFQFVMKIKITAKITEIIAAFRKSSRPSI
jgi:hypothetical protein